ncbi:carboxypeptidase inhibitor-like [Amblyomma americanum]
MVVGTEKGAGVVRNPLQHSHAGAAKLPGCKGQRGECLPKDRTCSELQNEGDSCPQKP